MKRATLALLLCGCDAAPGPPEKSPPALLRSDVERLSPMEIWELTWKRMLPEIEATPRPSGDGGFSAPDLAAEFRRGVEDGRNQALKERIWVDTICFFPKTDLQRAFSKGWDAGRSSINSWCSRVMEDNPIFVMNLGRPDDLPLSGEVPTIVFFGRETEAVFAAAAVERRKAAVVTVYASNYAGLGRRPDVLRAGLVKALSPARPGAIYVLAAPEGREALRALAADESMKGAWFSSEESIAPAFAGLPLR